MSAVLDIPSDEEIDELSSDHATALTLKGLARYQRQQAQKVNISRDDLDDALQREAEKLFLAEPIVQTLEEALTSRFGGDWPADVPDYRRPLRQAAILIQDAYCNLSVNALENNVADRARGAQS